MNQNILSATEVRERLTSKMPQKRKEETVTKTIKFSNRDVPEFLKQLNRFESASAKVDHRVG